MKNSNGAHIHLVPVRCGRRCLLRRKRIESSITSVHRLRHGPGCGASPRLDLRVGKHAHRPAWRHALAARWSAVAGCCPLQRDLKPRAAGGRSADPPFRDTSDTQEARQEDHRQVRRHALEARRSPLGRSCQHQRPCRPRLDLPRTVSAAHRSPCGARAAGCASPEAPSLSERQQRFTGQHDGILIDNDQAASLSVQHPVALQLVGRFELRVGSDRAVRVRRQLVDQHRQRLLRWVAVHDLQLACGWRLGNAAPCKQERADPGRTQPPAHAGLGSVARL